MVILALCLSFDCFTSADTLKLNNGEVIYGVFMGRNNDAIQFLGPDGSSKSYPLTQVATLTFGPIPSASQQAAASAPPVPLEITVPSGTFMLVRMSETLDTSTAQTGQIFTATLATNLAAQGYVVARQGTTVYGQVVEVSSARRLFGKSKITLQLTQIVINGTAIGITTDNYSSDGKSSTGRTARRTSAALVSVPASAHWRETLEKARPSVRSLVFFSPPYSEATRFRFRRKRN